MLAARSSLTKSRVLAEWPMARHEIPEFVPIVYVVFDRGPDFESFVSSRIVSAQPHHLRLLVCCTKLRLEPSPQRLREIISPLMKILVQASKGALVGLHISILEQRQLRSRFLREGLEYFHRK